jgi:hypothetical protein
VEVAAGLNATEAAAVARVAAATALADREIIRAVYVPDRLVNLVTA